MNFWPFFLYRLLNKVTSNEKFHKMATNFAFNDLPSKKYKIYKTLLQCLPSVYINLLGDEIFLYQVTVSLLSAGCYSVTHM